MLLGIHSVSFCFWYSKGGKGSGMCSHRNTGFVSFLISFLFVFLSSAALAEAEKQRQPWWRSAFFLWGGEGRCCLTPLELPRPHFFKHKLVDFV